MRGTVITSVKLFVIFLGFNILSACKPADRAPETEQAKANADELDTFVSKVKGDLVFVSGGKFWMGDYGVRFGPEGLPYDTNSDSKPLHEVELSSFSIQKYKVDNESFGLYLRYNGLTLRSYVGATRYWEDFNRLPITPAHLDWYEAEKYCAWLAAITDLPFAIPTEAQWEYAARSKGQFFMVATDDGTYRFTREADENGELRVRGLNISSLDDREEFSISMGLTTSDITPMPVNYYPPNPLGLYSMSDGGYEWVKDWYDPEYYRRSVYLDPQGPEIPMYKDEKTNYEYAKVLRGNNQAQPLWGGGVNVQRRYASPNAMRHSGMLGKAKAYLLDKTVRCAVNASDAIN